MNTVSAHTVISWFSRLALIAVAAFAVGVAFDFHPLALLSFAVGALTILIVAGDYAPRNHDWPASRDNVIDFASEMARTTPSEKRAA